MSKPLIIFGISKPNLYSYAALLGALESRKQILEKYDICVIRKNLIKIENLSPNLFKGYDLSVRPLIIIPISLLTSQFRDFNKFMQKTLPDLKIINKNIITIVGGWHSTGSPTDILNLGANFVIKGEAEDLFPDLLLKIYDLNINTQEKLMKL